jgi:hypothetical protein
MSTNAIKERIKEEPESSSVSLGEGEGTDMDPEEACLVKPDPPDACP